MVYALLGAGLLFGLRHGALETTCCCLEIIRQSGFCVLFTKRVVALYTARGRFENWGREHDEHTTQL